MTDLASGARKLRAELDRANRLGVPHVLIVGDDELASGAATLRDMSTGAQRPVPFDQAVSTLRELPGEPRA